MPEFHLTYRMKTLFPLLSLLFFSSCYHKKISKVFSFNGVVKTCILDSTSLTKEGTVQIIKQKYYPNSDCSNRPEYASYISWPANMVLDSKSKYYLFKYSPARDTINIDFRREKYMTLWHEDYGSLKFNNDILTLISKKYVWQRSFKMQWSSENDTLTLYSMD